MQIVQGLIAILIITLVVPSAEAKKARAKGVTVNHVDKQPQIGDDPSLCPTCVNFMDESMDILLNIIANGGVIGSCEQLCGYLKTELEAVVCELFCDYVGIQAFIDVLDVVDPDAIFYCMEIDVCPIKDTAKGVINSMSVQPTSGPTGTTFNVNVKYQVTSEIGTGELAIVVFPPDGSFPFGGGELLVDEADGTYPVQIQIPTQPSENEDFGPGVYNFTVALCEGTCGSIHAHAFTLAQQNGQFTITG